MQIMKERRLTMMANRVVTKWYNQEKLVRFAPNYAHVVIPRQDKQQRCHFVIL
jgi:hypothetical protein